jgi:branched-subunit amino acid aminotransferase/4-amino-4-deoxychorismate lyase
VITEPLVYLNDRFVPAAQAQLPIWDAGLVQGATVTEMTRTFGHRLYRLDDHLDRLFHALRVMHLDIGLSAAQLAELAHELVTHNARLVESSAELGLVQFVTAGEYAVYALGRSPRTGPTLCMHTFTLPFHRWRDRLRHGTHLRTPSIRQVPPECWDPAMKCRSRVHYYLAEQEVQRSDPTASALLLDLAGRVTETNTGNFLMVERGVLVSPPTTYTRPGVSRATVIELAGELGIPFVERDIPLGAALAADEAFLASTTYCLMPVTKLNDTTLGDGRPGPVFRRLLAAWSARVGVNIERQILAASP